MLLKMSVSSMSTYDKCPKQYHYKYIEKIKIEDHKNEGTELGSCAHEILELFHDTILKEPIGEESYASLMKKLFIQSIGKYELKQEQISELKQIVQDYLITLKRDGMPTIVGIERDFAFNLGEYKVSGFIDRIDKVADCEYRVVDYKTNKNPKYLTDFQLNVYAIAIKEMFPDAKKVTGSYILLKHQCAMKSWEFTDSDIKSCKAKIEKYGTLITGEKRWIKKPTVLCNYCEYRSICQDVWTE